MRVRRHLSECVCQRIHTHYVYIDICLKVNNDFYFAFITDYFLKYYNKLNKYWWYLLSQVQLTKK